MLSRRSRRLLEAARAQLRRRPDGAGAGRDSKTVPDWVRYAGLR